MGKCRRGELYKKQKWESVGGENCIYEQKLESVGGENYVYKQKWESVGGKNCIYMKKVGKCRRGELYIYE